MRLEIGTRVNCTDGVYGELADIVIDPLKKRVTHLVVQPEQGVGEARLVPIQLAKGRDDESPRSSWSAPWTRRRGSSPCTSPPSSGSEKTPPKTPTGTSASRTSWRCRTTPVVRSRPVSGELDSDVTMYYDRVPKGEVEIRRASAVISADGHSLGEVDGFVVDADEHITHFVLERGHLWGRKEVTIPIGAVARIETDEVHVALSKDEVGALPAVHVGRHG